MFGEKKVARTANRFSYMASNWFSFCYLISVFLFPVFHVCFPNQYLNVLLGVYLLGDGDGTKGEVELLIGD